jgi:outer membrane protein, multidrug efflux system
MRSAWWLLKNIGVRLINRQQLASRDNGMKILFKKRVLIRLLALTLVGGLSGCASPGFFGKKGPDFDAPKLQASITDKWVAPVPSLNAPHNADPRALIAWWAQLNDNTLVELIAKAQEHSASVAQAELRLLQARNGLAQIDASSLPNASIGLSQTRSAFSFGGPAVIRNQTQLPLTAGWEVDLFGRVKRESESALAKVKARNADWHDARVSVAAETANLYVQYRFCEQQVQVLAADSQSRAETFRLTDLAAKAGFQPLATAAVLRASAADANRRLIIQKSECAIALKSLVALTAMDENELQKKLSLGSAQLPVLKSFDIAAVPAKALSQRPDVLAAEFDVASASADIGAAEAAKYPRLTLAGSISPVRFSSAGSTINVSTWSIGPSLSLPLFDGGAKAANFELAKQSYLIAEHLYRAKARQAVKEVEDSLVRIQVASDRQTDTDVAAKGFKEALSASQSKWKVGIGSLLELEDARRQSLAADVELGILKRDQLLAWIGLYRAVGGGWQPTEMK